MRLYKPTVPCVLLLLLIFHNTINTGCKKKPDTPIVDTIINPPPPTNDTVALVKKLSVLTSLYPGYGIVPYRTYSFSYDNQKRLTTVGIKNHSNLVLQDTFTTRLDYIGNSKLPYRIIMPDINGSLLPNPASYDTTWFYYTAGGKLQKDSTFERWYGGYDRKPLYRIYTYPDTVTVKTDWYWSPSVTSNPLLARRDTVRLEAGGNPDFCKAVYVEDITTAAGGYALARYFTYSQVVNPLSKLNVSGTPYSLIYTNVKKEMLGNSCHPYVYNSNGWADYLDFVSPFVPTLFYISGYTRYGNTLGQGGTSFAIEITPWTVRPTYPAEIRVTMSTSLAGDKFIYRYTY
jgi:hypothetical protein